MGLQRSNVSPRGHIQNVGGISAAATTVQIEVDPLIPTSGNHSYFALSPDVGKTTLEIVKVSSYADLGGGVWELTIVRGQRGTTEKTHAEGAVVEHVNTSEDVKRAEEISRLHRVISNSDAVIIDPKVLSSAVFNSGVDSVLNIVENGEGDLTHTRSTASWYVDEDGDLRELGVHAAAIWGSGYRWFPQHTNEWTWSEDLTNAAYNKGSTNISADATTAPEGATTADKAIPNTSNSSHYVRRDPASPAADTVHTVSFFAKAAEETIIKVDLRDAGIREHMQTIDLTSGVAGGNGHGTAHVWWYPVGNGWMRVFASWNVGAHEMYVFIKDHASYVGDGASGLYLWGFHDFGQTFIEAPYIATTSSTATRNAGYVYDAQWKRGAAKVVSQLQATNIIDSTVNPTTTARWTLGGDAAAAFSVVDDLAELVAAGIHSVCTNGKVFKIDNAGGATEAFVYSTRSVSQGSHGMSLYVRGGTGSIAFSNTSGGNTDASKTAFSSFADFTRFETVKGAGGTRQFTVYADAGQTVYFILPQVQVGSVVDNVIPVAGTATVTRNADNWTTPYTREFDASLGLTMQISIDPKTVANNAAHEWYLELGNVDVGTPEREPRATIYRSVATRNWVVQWRKSQSDSLVTVELADAIAGQENVIQLVIDPTDDEGNAQLRGWMNGVEATPAAITLPLFGPKWRGEIFTSKDCWMDLFHAVAVPGVFTDPSVLESLFE